MHRLAILGAGNIAHAMAGTAAFLKREVEPYMVVSRDLARAEKLAAEFGFRRACGSYEELYSDPEPDIVYIATPHSHHYEQAMRCLQSGKNVLCEKSFCANYPQSKALIEFAERRKLFIGEAVWTRFLPAIAKACELVDAGAIGKVRAVHATFGGDLTHAERLVRPELAGGALLDLGIYTLTFADIFGQGNVARIASSALKTDSGVDAMHSIEIVFDSGVRAMLASSMVSPLPGRGIVYGDSGRLELPCFWGAREVEYYDGDGDLTKFDCGFECSGYEYEVRAMLRAIDAGKTETREMPHAKTLEIMQLMDRLRAEWKVTFPFEK